MKKWKQFLCGCLAGLLAAGTMLVSSPAAYAAGRANTYVRPDVDQDTSIEIHYHQRTLDFDNVAFRIYRVADMNENVRFEFVDRFDRYPVYFPSQMTASDWTRLADTLTGYVDRDDLKPDYTGTTNRRGRIYLDDLDAGLYLVIGDSHEREYRTEENGQTVMNHVYYQTAPFLVATPSLEDGTWYYDVTVSPKFSVSEDETISRRVLKVWDDAGYESQRPGAITVDLLRNNRIWDTVELNARNLWRYQWDDLDNAYQWRVVEHSAGNYRVTTRNEGMTVVVTNRYNYPEPQTLSEPEEPTLPTPPTTDIPEENPPLTDTPVTPVTPRPGTTTPTGTTPTQDLVDIPEEKPPLVSLPQTGQLWWPVPILAASGCLMFLAGIVMRRRSRRD